MPSYSTKVELVLDACAIINIANGDVFEELLQLPLHFYCLGDVVAGETESHRDVLENAVNRGLVTMIHPNDVSALTFLTLLDKYGLGAGETECITIAQERNFCICSDDARARVVGRKVLGQQYVVGTLKLLIDAVRLDILPLSDAENALQQMKSRGAFLPEKKVEWFMNRENRSNG